MTLFGQIRFYNVGVNTQKVFMQTSVRDYSYDQKETIKGFFTNDEWDAIDSALSDFQDYGERESELNDSVGRKIYELFKSDIRRGQ